MAQTKAIVDKLLTNLSVGIFPEGAIADKVLPFQKVVQSSGLIGTYTKDHLRVERSYVGGRAEYRRVEGVARSSATYLIEPHGLAGMVSEDDYRNVEQPFDAEKDEMAALKLKIELEKEKALADVLFSTSSITQNTTLSGTAQFNDYNNSDPIGVFKTARNTVYTGGGVVPNKAVMDWQTMNTLAYHPGILDALGFTQNRAGQLSEVELAKALGVEQLFVGKVVYNSAAEGQSAVLAPVWGKSVLFYYAPNQPGKYQQSLGFQLGFADKTRVFKNAINNPPNSTEILVDNHYDYVLTDVGAAYLIKDSIA